MYKTKDFFLTPMLKKDIEDERYRSWFTDQDVTKFNSHGLFPKSEKALIDFADNLGNNNLVLKICYGDVCSDGIHWIGNASLQSFNFINNSAELAIVIGEKTDWGKGLGTSVCEILLYHAFIKIGFNRVWTGTSKLNVGMQRICEKIGMKHEGTSRAGMYLLGEYHDIFHYGILRNEISFNPITREKY